MKGMIGHIRRLRLSFSGLLVLVLACTNALSQVQFDKISAFKYLEKQCSFGTRNPGSAGHKACRNFLLEELRAFTQHVDTQHFLYTDKRQKKTIRMTNIIAAFHAPETKGKPILLCAHWDTRPMADHDPDRRNRSKPILGANDGASGVAVLLEIARCFNKNPPPQAVTIVLFDGEDGGEDGDYRNWCLGSKYFAGTLTGAEFKFAILLDMIGDKDLSIPIEGYSYRIAPNLVDMIWGKAQKLGIKAFKHQIGTEVYDDHWALIQSGIPAVDIIDFDYPYWHTVNDTPDKCSPESLKAVGDVVIDVIYNL